MSNPSIKEACSPGKRPRVEDLERQEKGRENEVRMIAIYLGGDWLGYGHAEDALIECRVSLSPLRDRHVEMGRATYPITPGSTVCLHLQLRDISCHARLSPLAPEMFSADTTCIVSKRQ